MDEKIIELRKQGLEYREIASQLNTSVYFVCKALGKAGMRRSQQKDGAKTCSICVRHKPISEFCNNGLGKRSECKECTAVAAKRHLAYLKEWTYGVTQKQLGEILEAQNNKCAICRSDKAYGRTGNWHLDHDHKTGKVRQFLCHYCNFMLGLAKDEPFRLRAGADYLDRHTETPEDLLRYVGAGC